MTYRPEVLEQLSVALTKRALSARSSVAAIRISDDRHLTGTLWRSDVVVASEQSLPKGAEFELLVAGRSSKARFVGRDAGTNLALLRLAEPAPAPAFGTATAEAGALALAFGADARGDVTVRTGVVIRVGPEWHSSEGRRFGYRQSYRHRRPAVNGRRGRSWD